MPTHTFQPYIQTIPRKMCRLPDTDLDNINYIRNEPMLYSAGYDFARQRGGPLTLSFLDAMPEYFRRATRPKHFVLDTRVYMLMPGQQGAIPGWHCDAVKRGNNGQPDLWNSRYDDNNLHITAALSCPAPLTRTLAGETSKLDIQELIDPGAKTEFCAVPMEDVPYDREAVWDSVNSAVKNKLTHLKTEPKTIHVPDGRLVQFDSNTLHRATPAKLRQWRWWARASWYHNPPRNEIRNQVQVYTTERGW